jgi:hypothetical protein
MSAINSSDISKMSSATKSSKKSTVAKSEAPVAVAVAAPVAAPAPAAPKVSKKAAKVVEAPAPAPAPAPVAAPVAPTPEAVAHVADEDLGAALQKSIAALQENLASLKAAASAAGNALKAIEKQAARLAKKADRKKKRSTKTEGGEPKACIFTKPVKVTDELCAFLGNPKGTEISRSAVTKGVMGYAKAHNLMDKQTIKADAALRKLLTLSETDSLSILNLQKYLGRHFVKTVVTAPVAN